MKKALIWLVGFVIGTQVFVSSKTEAMFTTNTFCATCFAGNNFMYSPYGGYGGMNPWGGGGWWMPYGQAMYSNAFMPGMFSPWGMQGNYYPGGGHGFMGKPNIYVNGKPGTDVSFQVKLPETSNWLIAVPKHGEKGWNGKIASDGAGVQIGKAKHPFFYMDLRVSEDSFQDKAGFCVGRDALIPRIKASMHELGFKKNEIKDFETYWSMKIPPAKGYCVFPQETQELDPVANYQITPKPESVTRVLFMITLTDGDKDPQGTLGSKFKKRPTADWKPATARRSIAAAKGGLTVREWGIGFLEAAQ